MAEIKCEKGNDACTFPMCTCAIIEGNPLDPAQAASGPSPDDAHPECGSVTRAENDAARELLGEFMRHQGSSPDFWNTWNAVELVVRHLRKFATPQIEGGPTCHPRALWTAGAANADGTYQAVCSVCGQPAGGKYLDITVSREPGIAEFPPEYLPDTGAPAMVPIPPAQEAVGDVPPCHPFSFWAAKGDGTTVCAYCATTRRVF